MNKALRTLYLYNGIFVLAGGLFGPLYAVYAQKIGADVFVISLSWSIFLISSTLFTFIVSKFGDKVEDAYEKLINNAIFLQTPLENKIINIDLETTTLAGTNLSKFNININEFNTFLINNPASYIILDELRIELTNGDQNNNNNSEHILNALEYVIRLIKEDLINDKDIYILIKNKLLNMINTTNDSEIRNRSIVMYNLVRKLFNKILTHELGKIDPENNNIKILINYGKNTNNILNNNNNNNNKIKQDQILNNICQITKINSVENIGVAQFISTHQGTSNDMFLESCEFFNSSVTLSNWFDEIQNNNGLGLLLKIDSKTTGYSNQIIIDNITNVYFPIVDYILAANTYFEKHVDTPFGNLNKQNIISGLAIGDSNSVIPFYINKYHWLSVKNYIEPLLGIIVSHNPFNYGKSLKVILFTLFVDMTSKLFDHSKKYLNEKYIKIYVAYLRTCAEICFENKFNYGIKKMIAVYLTDPLSRISKDKITYDKICSQALVTGYVLNDVDLKSIILYFIEESIRLAVKDKKYDETYVKYYFEKPIEARENDEANLIQQITDKIQYDLLFLLSFHKMNNIMNDIIVYSKSYNKFIKSLDDSYGLISDDISKQIYNFVENNVNGSYISLAQMYDSIGVEYNKYNILMYIFQGILQRSNKIREEQILNEKYVDVQKNAMTQDKVNGYILELYKIENNL